MARLILIPQMYFNPDGSKAKCLTEGGFYRKGRAVDWDVGKKILDVWDKDKPYRLSSLMETIQIIELRDKLIKRHPAALKRFLNRFEVTS